MKKKKKKIFKMIYILNLLIWFELQPTIIPPLEFWNFKIEGAFFNSILNLIISFVDFIVFKFVEKLKISKKINSSFELKSKKINSLNIGEGTQRIELKFSKKQGEIFSISLNILSSIQKFIFKKKNSKNFYMKDDLILFDKIFLIYFELHQIDQQNHLVIEI